MPVNLRKYQREIEAGLPNEKQWLDQAQEKLDFYHYQGFKWERRFRRDAESSFDYQGRSHRGSGFLNETVGKLCDHLYSPGPARRWSEDSGDELLQRVYLDNHINALMLEADEQSTLNNFCAIQIDPGVGDFAVKPITYRFWGREQLVVWADPDNANVPEVICTIDRYDEQTRVRAWTDTQCWTFLSKKQRPDNLSDGTVLYPVGPPVDHGYGCLPFTLVHYRLPLRGLDMVVAVGEFLFKAEVAIDDRLFRTDESIHKHLNPIPWAKGMPDQWKPILEAQRFIRLPSAMPHLSVSGGYETGDYAEIGYVQVTIDVAGAWEDLNNYILQALDAAGIPRSSVRMETVGVASGISLIVEQEPLIKRAETRRPMWCAYETDLGKRTLILCGNHYGMSELLTAGEKGHIITAWPQARLAVNTPDKLELGIGEVQAGLKSHLMLIQDWYGVGRDEAIEIAEQIALDQADLEKANPALRVVNAPPDPDEEGSGAGEENEDPANPNAGESQ
jgi:hypothetical protein